MTAEIQFSCDQCGQDILAEASSVGGSFDCPGCGKVLTVPSGNVANDLTNGEHFAGEAHSSELEAIQKELAHSLAERERLVANATHQKAEMARFQTERAGLRADVAQLKQAFAEKTQEVDETRVRVTQLEEAITGLQGKLAKSRERVADLETALHRKDLEIKEAFKSADPLRVQIAGLENDFYLQQQRTAATQTQLEVREQEIGEWQTAVEQLRTERTSLEHEAIALRQQLAALQHQLEQRDQAIESIEHELKSETATLDKVRRDAAGFHEASELLRGELEKTRGQLGDAISAQEKLASVQKDLDERAKQIRVLEEEKKEVETKRDALQQEVATLRSDLESSKEGREIVGLRDELATSKRERKDLAGTVAALESDLRSRAGREKELKSQLGDARKQLEDAVRRAESVSDERMKQDNEVLRGIVARQNVELEVRHREIMRLKGARLALRIIYGLFALGLVGLGYLAMQYLPMLGIHLNN